MGFIRLIFASVFTEIYVRKLRILNEMFDEFKNIEKERERIFNKLEEV